MHKALEEIESKLKSNGQHYCNWTIVISQISRKCWKCNILDLVKDLQGKGSQSETDLLVFHSFILLATHESLCVHYNEINKNCEQHSREMQQISVNVSQSLPQEKCSVMHKHSLKKISQIHLFWLHWNHTFNFIRSNREFSNQQWPQRMHFYCINTARPLAM